MIRTRFSLFYLAGYLIPAGLLLLFAPTFSTKLLLSNGLCGTCKLTGRLPRGCFKNSNEFWIVTIMPLLICCPRPCDRAATSQYQIPARPRDAGKYESF